MEYAILSLSIGILIGWFIWAKDLDLMFVLGLTLFAFAVGMLF